MVGNISFHAKKGYLLSFSKNEGKHIYEFYLPGEEELISVLSDLDASIDDVGAISDMEANMAIEVETPENEVEDYIADTCYQIAPEKTFPSEDSAGDSSFYSFSTGTPFEDKNELGIVKQPKRITIGEKIVLEKPLLLNETYVSIGKTIVFTYVREI